MNNLLKSLESKASSTPDTLFLHGKTGTLTFAETVTEIKALSPEISGQCIGLLMDNGPAWAIADLAIINCGITCVPIPAFFSSAQIVHSLKNAGVDLLLTDTPVRIAALYKKQPNKTLTVANHSISFFQLAEQTDKTALNGIAKITYTSGTTGTPKGVCLTLSAMEQVAHSIAAVTEVNEQDSALSLLPLSTLLENIGSLYIQLLRGGCCTFLPMHEVGMQGASGLDLPALLSTLNQQQPTSIILIPQMLHAIVEAAEAGATLPGSLRFIAVGGAPVSKTLLQRAVQLNIPVYEGYGLSEAGSVVAVNSPAASRIGSVGKPLSHTQLKIAEDGEILLRGNLFNGYLGDPPLNNSSYWPTGDLGYLDKAGFLHLTGRKKNIFITAFGRNVAPEWVERELLIQPVIVQAILIGEALPFNTAIIVPQPQATALTLAAAIAQVNKQLPDYARISHYLIADEPFHINNGQLTGTGRPRRNIIASHYADAIKQIYKTRRNLMHTKQPGHSIIATTLILFGVNLFSLPILAGTLEDGITVLQHEWAKSNYKTPEDQQENAFEKLTKQAEALAQQYPDKAEPLIWQAIITSSDAGATGGLSALGKVKHARDLLQAAEQIDPNALNGSIYTSLGSLYYQVPGWPLSFGDSDKAARYLSKAISVNPDGIDSNYFYGDYLRDQGKYEEALNYLNKALNAPEHAGRPIADEGRRAEIRKALEEVKAKL